jgi:S1-C subfamily serine protease
MAVPPDAAAGEDAVQLYDVIEEAARQPVTTVADFQSILGNHPEGAPLLLKVRRVIDGQPVSRLAIWNR